MIINLCPSFVCLQRSILSKSHELFMTLKDKINLNWMFFGIACTGAIFVAVAIFTNFYKAIGYGQLNYLVFTVEGSVGYSFFNSKQIIGANGLVYVQYIGFAMVLSGLMWIAKDQIRTITTLKRQKNLNLTKSIIEIKNLCFRICYDE